MSIVPVCFVRHLVHGVEADLSGDLPDSHDCRSRSLERIRRSFGTTRRTGCTTNQSDVVAVRVLLCGARRTRERVGSPKCRFVVLVTSTRVDVALHALARTVDRAELASGAKAGREWPR